MSRPFTAIALARISSFATAISGAGGIRSPSRTSHALLRPAYTLFRRHPCRLFLTSFGEGSVSNPPSYRKLEIHGKTCRHFRSRGDSNPRYPFGAQLLSREPDSAALAPLHQPFMTFLNNGTGGFGLRHGPRVRSSDPPTPSDAVILPALPPFGRRGLRIESPSG